MIIVAIVALAGVVLAVLYSLFQAFPVIPNTFWATIATMLPYIARGVKFVNGFIYPEIVWPLAGACIVLHTHYVGVRVVMWIVKKIPMLGVSD